MELKLDTSKTYAVALEGGGARGAYQIGAWKAMNEVGIKYNAVSGCSVGALNGAMMVMQDLPLAEKLWLDMNFSRVMDVDDNLMDNILKGKIFKLDYRHIGDSIKKVLSDRGFDVTPLRNLIKEFVDYQKLQSSSIDFYISTYSVTDKTGLELKADTLSPDQLSDMLLASAYFPAFKHEPLGGKNYTDGGAFNVLPISSLIEAGHKDIIVLRLYGMGIEKKVKIPKDTEFFTVAPNKSLGNMLDFSKDSCQDNFKLGYYDAKRTLYGLYGEKYYIDRTMTEADAYRLLSRIAKSSFAQKEGGKISLRRLHEKYIPKIGRELSSKGDYYDLLIDLFETAADKFNIDEFEILTDREFIEKVYSVTKNRNTLLGAARFLTGGRWYEKEK